MDILLLLFLILIVVPSSTLIHEMGHALAARMIKAETISLSIGRGKQLLQFRFERFQMTIYAVYFLDGLTSSSRVNPYSKRERLWITALGPVFNGIIAFLLFLFLTGTKTNLYFYYLVQCLVRIR
ncbi:hypothetical protein CV093_11405 [Oceanobacillus sp. 143]|nr:hypothetical protein CV093_11405 [Oceanobacillus sp. 143]